MIVQSQAVEQQLIELIHEVIKMRNYISYLHPVNQKALIRIFNYYLSTGSVDEDAHYKLQALYDILLNYSNP